MITREIALGCRGIPEDSEITAEKRAETRAATDKTFYEVMEMTPNDTWEMSNGEATPHIFLYQEEEGDPILQEDETDCNQDEVDNFDAFLIWRDNIRNARLKKAAEWLFSRQSAIQKCRELGLRPFIRIYVQLLEGVGGEYLVFPSQFVAACGRADLPVELSIK
jgi:hypothetical protein